MFLKQKVVSMVLDILKDVKTCPAKVTAIVSGKGKFRFAKRPFPDAIILTCGCLQPGESRKARSPSGAVTGLLGLPSQLPGLGSGRNWTPKAPALRDRVRPWKWRRRSRQTVRQKPPIADRESVGSPAPAGTPREVAP